MTGSAIRSTRENVARATFCSKQRIYGHFIPNCGTCHIPVTNHPRAMFCNPTFCTRPDLFHNKIPWHERRSVLSVTFLSFQIANLERACVAFRWLSLCRNITATFSMGPMNDQDESEHRREREGREAQTAADAELMLKNTQRFLENLSESAPESRRYVSALKNNLEKEVRQLKARKIDHPKASE